MAEQLISTAVHHTLPDSYVRSEVERPRLDEVVPDADIPVVDLANPNRAAVVAQIGAACSSHGFFQVLNHGQPVEGEEMWPVSPNPRPVPSDYVTLPEKGKKKNAHLAKTSKKKNPAEQAQGNSSASASQPQAPAAARTSSVSQAPAAGTNANRFKPPRKRAATAEAGSSAVPAQPEASTSRRTGTGAKRGRRRAASSVPSDQYFTCNGNY